MANGAHIIRTEFRERCFIYQSFGKRESNFGDLMLEAHVSFLADSGIGTAAEWEPQYGPIQLFTECSKDWEDETENGNKIESRCHWHFPHVKDESGRWSQLAVDDEGLKPMLLRGDMDGVFDVLMRWANR